MSKYETLSRLDELREEEKWPVVEMELWDGQVLHGLYRGMDGDDTLMLKNMERTSTLGWHVETIKNITLLKEDQND